MSENYKTVISNGTDSNIAPSQLKPRRIRKSTAGIRKIHHTWTDDEIYRLIASVKKHRGLWDFTSPEYKLSKQDGWKSVADDVGIDGVDLNEAKVKFSSLRSSYTVNLSKLRKKQSRQAPNGTYIITWKFFDAMMFLKNINVEHSTSSSSALQLESDYSEPSPPSPSEFTIGNQRKNSRSNTPSPSSSPTVCSISHTRQSMINSTVAPLCSSDTNSTFCDNLLAELRTLSESTARTLRFKISRLMMDFIEANQDPIS